MCEVARSKIANGLVDSVLSIPPILKFPQGTPMSCPAKVGDCSYSCSSLERDHLGADKMSTDVWSLTIAICLRSIGCWAHLIQQHRVAG